MNMQTIIVILLFAGAVFYLGRMMYKSLTTKKACGGNCKCGVDFSGIEPAKTAKR
ncbi:FeoB-associated Cys-rich membrane protein [Mucilaginibacter celer]|uniref:FeoB-associated Cys-rich membrane protein n=2 Tax=Mucilaginibacter celer TaxID=2305508 RepID=A0A494VRL0_9SPHI|nr:FeoB-associated Cys-rich membrane protein [Mucilaginibacter celer]